uniref:Uncharacterized protein n=1 Tax=Trepomonas sp. PC1 TaxID=1076344 RepID=A0A146KLF7_9EUKA|eukprot:JAP96226.1 Hypothetical protein TPC1_10508 [Trepomonas sp. PC1]
MPIRLEDGTVAYKEDEKDEESQNSVELHNFEEPQQQKQDQIDFKNGDEVRKKIATLCTTIMGNPNDKSTVNALLKLVEQFDNLPEQDPAMKRDIDYSLEILLKNTRDEGPLSQLKGLYNARLDEKFTTLIKYCFQGHQNSYNQLEEALKLDTTFMLHCKVITIAYELLLKNKFKVDSSIFLNLFLKTKITKISNLIPKYKQRKQLFQKSQKDKAKDEQLTNYTKQFLDKEQADNQQTFLSNLMILTTLVIRSYQQSQLLKPSLQLLLRFGSFLNEIVYLDLIAVIKMYFYAWFASQKSFQKLLVLLNEEDQQLFDLRVNKQFNLQQQFTQIQNYVNQHEDQLVLYKSYQKLFSDFETTLDIIGMISQPYLNSTVKNDSAVALVYILSHIYKINEKNVGMSIQCFRHLLDGVGGAAKLLLKIVKIVKLKPFEQYVRSVCMSTGVDFE